MFDLEKLKADLIAAGQLSAFLEVVEYTTPLFNCTVENAFKAGPNGKGNQGEIWLRQNILCKKGMIHPGECHPRGHSTFFFGGIFLVLTQDVDKDGNPIGDPVENFYGTDHPGSFSHVYIPANKWHQVIAVSEGGTMVCAYVMVNSLTGQPVSQFDGDRQPYSQRKKPWPDA